MQPWHLLEAEGTSDVLKTSKVDEAVQ
jgi:hypothetical protein